MKTTGFTIIKNAVKYDYPVVEAITSILSICDEFIVSIGDCEDGTFELIKNINSTKIKIIRSIWDETAYLTGKEHVLATETNKVIEELPEDTDWAFYIQSDEVVHEKDLPAIRKSMRQWKDDNKVECLVFNYKHFYGSYDYIGAALHWYRREIRAFKPISNIKSYRDAQGFRKDKNTKLKGKLTDVYIYHYGWVRPPEVMKTKQNNFASFYHKEPTPIEEFEYNKNIKALYRFEETHPKVMIKRIKEHNWQFEFDISFNKFRFKDKVKLFFRRLTGWQPGEFKNYKLI